MIPGLRSALPLLILAALVFGGFRLLVRPSRSAAVAAAEHRAEGFSARIAEAENAPAGGTERGSDEGSGARLHTELARLRERVAVLGAVVQREEAGGAVLHSLTGLAGEENVRFRRFAPEPETRLGGYIARAATVVAEGRFFDFVRLFERVSALPQLVLVEEVEFRTAPDGVLTSRFVAITIRRGAAADEEPASGIAGEGL